MTIASDVLKAHRTTGFAAHAKFFGGKLYDRDAGYTFYIFADDSKIGTKGRGNNWQAWEVGETK